MIWCWSWLCARGGKVVAFEMGPPFQMLDINKRYLPNIIACCHYFHQCILNWAWVIHYMSISQVKPGPWPRYLQACHLWQKWNSFLRGNYSYKIKTQVPIHASLLWAPNVHVPSTEWILSRRHILHTCIDMCQPGFRVQRVQQWDQRGREGRPSRGSPTCAFSSSEIFTVGITQFNWIYNRGQLFSSGSLCRTFAWLRWDSK